VLYNKGEGAPVPRWNIRLDPPVDLTARAAVLESLSNAVPGLRVSKRALYEEYGITEPDDDDDALELGAAVPMGAGMFSRAVNAPVPKPPAPRVLDAGAKLWLASKRVATPSAWEALSPAGKARAWWITGLNTEQTTTAAKLLLEGFEAGDGETAYLMRLEEAGLGVPGETVAGPGQIPAWHARVVYRNNEWGAAQASQYQRLSADVETRPYWRWLAHDPCPICSPMAGNVARFDAAVWSQFYPPLHHQCRCEVVSVSEGEIAQEPALRSALDKRNPSPDGPDPSFAFHPGDAYYAPDGSPATPVGEADALILDTLERTP